jgi:HD-like signal output (HDOD) protein
VDAPSVSLPGLAAPRPHMIEATPHHADDAPDAADLLQGVMAALGRGDTRVALDGVVSAVGALTDADAACIGIRHGADHVLVSTWGTCPLPRGLRAVDLLARLEARLGAGCTWPLLTQGGAVGWLWVGRRDGRGFAAREIELVQTLAELTALRLGRARPLAVDETSPHLFAAGVLSRADADADAAPPLAPEMRVRDAERDRLVVPAFPPALARIVAATDDETGSLAALADAVTLDPLLPPRVLRAANAPSFGRRRAVTSITEALGILGMRGVRNLAVGQFARTLFARWEPVDQMLWEQALGTAVGTQLLLERGGQPGGEDGYLCGLLHNMATVALQSAEPERYREIVRIVAAGQLGWDDAERWAFGVPALARLPELLADWALPATVEHVLRAAARRETPGPLGEALACARWLGLRTSAEWQRLLAGRPDPTWLADAIAATTAGRDAQALAAIEPQIAERCRALRRLMD